MRARLSAGTLVAAAAVIVIASAAWALTQSTSTAVPSARTNAPASPTDVPHIERAPGVGPYLSDGSGRQLFLRGVAVTGLIKYASDYDENPPLTLADAKEIAALGFNYVRLPVSWSQIEPSPGQFDPAYLGEISRAVHIAKSFGLDVVVDFHTDRYNQNLAPGNEADGAPDWATVTNSGLSPSACVAKDGSATCVQQAWQNFWTDAQVDGKGLQQWYDGALEAVSLRVRSDTNLLGLELMNNPSTGYEPLPGFERDELRPFFRQAISALRTSGEHRPLWIDDAAGSEQTGVYSGPMTRLLPDSQLVYAPHNYVGVFSNVIWPVGGIDSLLPWYASTEEDASTFGMASVIGEWGIGPVDASDLWIQTQLNLQDEFRLGSAFWMWKQRPGFYNWQVVNLNGTLRTDSMRAQMLSEPHPDAVPGVLQQIVYAPGGMLMVKVRGSGGVARLWSGAEVVNGGQSLLNQPLTSARIDGRRVSVKLQPRDFTAPGVALRGDIVVVNVPAGTHTITLQRP